jgi:hypothetical protein
VSALPASLFVLVFAATLLLSGALLFLVQPILGKLLLPRLGGSAAVWGTCLVFFQLMLLAGYAYAHGALRVLGARRQAAVHLLLVGLPLLLWGLGAAGVLPPGTPFGLGDWAPTPGGNPVLGLFLLLLTTVGLPFFVLAATAPLLQRWFAASGHPEANDPYFLYAASNLGSMAALVLYPSLLEPSLGLAAQQRLWLYGYVVLAPLVVLSAALLCLASRWAVPWPLRLGERADPVPARAGDSADPPLLPAGLWAVLRRLRWLALSALPAALLVGLNTYAFTDLFASPLFWVAPLALYLLSFIQAFARQPLLSQLHWVARLVLQLLHGLAIVALVVLLLILTRRPEAAHDVTVPAVALAVLVLLMPRTWLMVVQPLVAVALVFDMLTRGPSQALEGLSLPLHLLGLYVAARACHTELARDRPPAARLTGFFFWVALGGALGGAFSALLAPLLFRTAVTEYWLAVILVCLFRPGSLVNGGTDALFMLLLNAGGRMRARAKRLARAISGGVCDLLWPVVIALFTLLLWSSATARTWGPNGVDLLTWMLDKAQNEPDPRKAVDRAYLSYRLVVYGIPLLLCALVAARRVRFGLALGLVVGAITYAEGGLERDRERGQSAQVLLRDRDYFGLFAVHEKGGRRPFDQMGFGLDPPRHTYLMHGTTHHGLNYQEPPELRRRATTYYHRRGPVGQVMRRFDWFGESFEEWDRLGFPGGAPFPGGPRPPSPYPSDARLPASLVGMGANPLGGAAGPWGLLVTAWSEPAVGVVGLGVGTMAAYARPLQHVHFYEIDGRIKDLSLPPEGKPRYFNFLEDARKRGAHVQVSLGDGRTTLAREGPDGFYHVLVLDAFVSDAIPAHLLTREAFELYFRKLAPGGVLCVHVSNRHVNLVPVVADVAESLKLFWERARDPGGQGRFGGPDSQGHFASEWVVVARNPRRLVPRVRLQFNDFPQPKDLGVTWDRPDYARRGGHVWTDDHNNLRDVLRGGLDRRLNLLVLLLLAVGGVVVLVELLSWVAVLLARRPVVLAPADEEIPEAVPFEEPDGGGGKGTEH